MPPKAGYGDYVEFICGDHAQLPFIANDNRGFKGSTSAVVMNLGYLPGSNRELVTTPSTTISALHHALVFLKPEGVLSVTAYKGHSRGHDEAAAVNRWFVSKQEQGALHNIECIDGSRKNEHAPQLFVGFVPA